MRQFQQLVGYLVSIVVIADFAMPCVSSLIALTAKRNKGKVTVCVNGRISSDVALHADCFGLAIRVGVSVTLDRAPLALCSQYILAG